MNIPTLSAQKLLELKMQYGKTTVIGRIKVIKNSKLYLIKDRLDIEILNPVT